MELPGWVSLLPPLVAIVAALVSRQVIPSLVLGTWVGAWAVAGLDLRGLWTGLLDVPGRWVLEALAPPDGDTAHASIVLFTLLIGGLVGVITRSGGTRGVVDLVTRFAATRRRGQATTAGLGLVIFFDDYANTLVLGNSLRPVTDRLRVSREKLAYLVDSTSAPVASLALVSTWIGFEVGLIDDALGQIGVDESGYGGFVASLPYRFYPVLALVLVFAVATSGRDLRAMHRAERRAAAGEVVRPGTPGAEPDPETAPDEDAPHRAVNALLPLGVLVGGTLAFLLASGEGETLRDVVGSADPYSALVSASLLAVLVAVVLAVGQRLLTVGEATAAWFSGLTSVVHVLIVLVLAWALAAVSEELGTAAYLGDLLGDALPLWSVPALVFVVAAATAFATGTSWGTMGILMPLAVPLAWTVAQGEGAAADVATSALWATVGTVLAGAVWGDHCSPISDTTVLSALACGCDPVDHVRTQLPYALLAGAASTGALLAVGAGVSAWLVWPVAAAVVLGVLRWRGQALPDEEPGADGRGTAVASGPVVADPGAGRTTDRRGTVGSAP